MLQYSNARALKSYVVELLKLNICKVKVKVIYCAKAKGEKHTRIRLGGKNHAKGAGRRGPVRLRSGRLY